MGCVSECFGKSLELIGIFFGSEREHFFCRVDVARLGYIFVRFAYFFFSMSSKYDHHSLCQRAKGKIS